MSNKTKHSFYFKLLSIFTLVGLNKSINFSLPTPLYLVSATSMDVQNEMVEARRREAEASVDNLLQQRQSILQQQLPNPPQPPLQQQLPPPSAPGAQLLQQQQPVKQQPLQQQQPQQHQQQQQKQQQLVHPTFAQQLPHQQPHLPQQLQQPVQFALINQQPSAPFYYQLAPTTSLTSSSTPGPSASASSSSPPSSEVPAWALELMNQNTLLKEQLTKVEIQGKKDPTLNISMKHFITNT